MSDLAAQMLAVFWDPALAYCAFSALMTRLKVRGAHLARPADLQSQEVLLSLSVMSCEEEGLSQQACHSPLFGSD